MIMGIRMTNSIVNRASTFQSQVKAAFEFLETERGMSFSGVREIKGDARDAALVATYRGDPLKIDIGWSELELSLAVLIHLNRNELPKQIRYVYLESFVEYIHGEGEPSTVPQIYPRMSEARILDAMSRRQELFSSSGFTNVILKLSKKLRVYFDEISHASTEQVRGYHQWLELGAKPPL